MIDKMPRVEDEREPVVDTGQRDMRMVTPAVCSDQFKEATKEKMTSFECQMNCSCTCHTDRSFKSPWALRALLGELNVQYNFQQPRPVCRCKGASLKVTYQFPQFLMRRYISFAMHQNSAAGPEFLLRIPRVMPWSHMLWRYSLNGNVQAIQKMFEDRLASPYDINPQGGNALNSACSLKTCEVAQFHWVKAPILVFCV